MWYLCSKSRRKCNKKVKAKISLLGWEYASDAEYTKEDIIDLIESDKKVYTILKNSTGNWETQAEVIIYTIDGTKFIKTVANNKKEDNLDNLPQY